MSQVGKLYKFYFRKIWQKNWLRIIIFTILIGMVWWFVIPWAGITLMKNYSNIDKIKGEASEEDKKEIEKITSFSELARTVGFGGKMKIKGKKIKKFDERKKKIRECLEDEEKFLIFLHRSRIEKGSSADRLIKWGLRMGDSGVYFGLLSLPFNSDNSFFFSQTDGYTDGKAFWKMLFDISWWNLSGMVVLYWFIFEVFDKIFFLPHQDGEEATVLTMTPGVKRSDVIWGKSLAFLTFYFLINIFLFLIPFGIYYFWLASTKSFAWFSLLSLITIIVGPLLFFGLIFTPYLFYGSLTGQKWIFSTLVSFFPLLWGGLKLISSASWSSAVERTFFDPIWFTVISVVCGIFFLTLYYLRYQEEDLH